MGFLIRLLTNGFIQYHVPLFNVHMQQINSLFFLLDMAALTILVSFRLLVNEALSVQWRQSFQSSEMYYVWNSKLLLEDSFYDFVFFDFSSLKVHSNQFSIKN